MKSRSGGPSGNGPGLNVGRGNGVAEEVGDGCTLTHGQVRLLQAAADIGSTCSKELARELVISRHTVDTEWRCLLERLSVHDRGAAATYALAHRWIHHR